MRQVGCLDGAPLTRGTFSCCLSPFTETPDEETAEATVPTNDSPAVVGSKRARVDDAGEHPPRTSSKLASGASRRIDRARHAACGAPPASWMRSAMQPDASVRARGAASAAASYSFKGVCKASDKALPVCSEHKMYLVVCERNGRATPCEVCA